MKQDLLKRCKETLAEAQERQGAGDHSGALERLDTVARSLANHAQFHLVRARSLRAVGRQVEADASVLRALELEPGLPEAVFELASLLYQRDHAAEVARLFVPYVERHPEDTSSLKILAETMVEGEESTRAIELLRTAWMAGADPKALSPIAVSIAVEGYPNDATALLSEFVASASDLEPLIDAAKEIGRAGYPWYAADLLRKIVRLDPDNATAWRRLAVYAARAGKKSEARSAARRAVRLRPASQAAWWAYGETYRLSGQFWRALHASRLAAAIMKSGGPQEEQQHAATIIILEIRCLLALNRLDDALVRAADAQARFSQNDFFPLARASVLGERGEHAAALRVMDEAFAAGIPRGGRLAPLYFRALHGLRRREDAWQFLEPLMGEHREGDGWVEGLRHVGEGFYLAGDVSRAQAIFTQLHELAPDDSALSCRAAFMLVGRGALPEAQRLLEQVVQDEYDFALRAEALASMGYIYLLTGHWFAARKALEAATDAANDDALGYPERADDDDALRPPLRIAVWRDGFVNPDPVSFPTRKVDTRVAARANLVTLHLAAGRTEEAEEIACELVGDPAEIAVNDLPF